MGDIYIMSFFGGWSAPYLSRIDASASFRHGHGHGHGGVTKVQKVERVERDDDKPVKHTNDYKIVVVLDESGSMETIRDSMRTALNGLIAEQKSIKERPCSFTLVKFNNSVNRVIENKSLKSIKPIEKSDYVPDGTTALYDAVGDTINWFRYERDVLMVIITDGQENASKRYHKEEVLKMIKEKEKYAGWSYVYLSCDMTTATQGDNIGLNTSNNCSNCVVPQADYGQFMSSVSAAIRNHRQYGASVQSQLNR